MAVRHLKRYVSWVQTVQDLNESWGVEWFESRGIENDIQKNHGGSVWKHMETMLTKIGECPHE